MPDLEGSFTATPLGVLEGVVKGIEAAGPDHRADITVVLGRDAYLSLAPRMYEDGSPVMPDEAKLLILETTLAGFGNTVVGFAPSEGDADRLVVVCANSDGGTFVTNLYREDDL